MATKQLIGILVGFPYRKSIKEEIFLKMKIFFT